ncbi:MAG: hypothetical protein EAX87_11785 [Candidatus Thorarchaeota archaeon]|nr:hypothetical protein [Candidatus Thorarchaeota archaeon]
MTDSVLGTQQSLMFRITASFVLMMLLISTVNCSIQLYQRNNTISAQTSHGASLQETTISPKSTYDTKSLATDFTTLDYTVTNSPWSFEGYTLFNLVETDSNNNTLVIMDMNGTVVAQKYVGVAGGVDCPAEFINPNTILTGSQWGAALWFLNNDTLKILGFLGHHEFEYNPNSNTIFTFWYNVIEIDGTSYRFDFIQERAMNGTLVWQLDVHDFIPESWWCPAHEMAGPSRDISHSNTIFYDAEEDMIYYNSRNTNTFFKIDHSTKEVIWGLGEHGNFAMYNQEGILTDNLFFHAHAVEKLNDTHFILFDNDYHNQSSSASRNSRILEIEIDEVAMTARAVWSYTAPRDYYSAGWGDADLLPNGNRIGAWGYPSSTISGLSAALVEVNSHGEVVWETKIMAGSYPLYGIYRLERFRFEPILSSPPDVSSLMQAGTITWDVWYNYRNKEPLPGNYTFYVDGNTFETGNFTYAKFWNPTSLAISYEGFNAGVHNITLAVSDGYGHTTSDTVTLTLRSFLIDRSGYTILEKGQESFLPTWSGFTVSELRGNITLNGTLFQSLNWTGQDVTLSPNLISPGTYRAELDLYNGSLLVYNDTFWLQVTPMAPPIILPSQPGEVSYIWGEPMVLSWDLYDVTAHSWSLLLDGTEISAGSWSPTNYQLNWSVPLLQSAVHNITVVADDDLGQVSTSQCLLTVPPPTFPLIFSSPGNSTIEWGSEGVSFLWEVSGGNQWVLYRNGTSLGANVVSSNEIEVAIDDWRAESWRPGLYNLTLVYSLATISAIDTIWVSIAANPGDPYADDYLIEFSQGYLSGSNAIGAPDGQYTTLFPEYEDGYISLDMGENEEIVNGPGVDFTVEAKGGDYRVFVVNSLETYFELLGTASGQASFDLDSSSLEQARYVRIQYMSGENVELDAIVAIHFNRPPGDITPPSLFIDDSQYSIEQGAGLMLTWSGYDVTPWSYDIYVNSTHIVSELWYGEDIEYWFTSSTAGRWNVTLVAYDAFGNSATSTVMIEVTHSAVASLITALVIGGIAAGIAVLTGLIIWTKKKGS